LILIQAAICILVTGVAMAGLMKALPHLGRARAVRRFRKRLAQLEHVVMIWEHSVDTRRDRPPHNSNDPA
jgi:hypothetical protein